MGCNDGDDGCRENERGRRAGGAPMRGAWLDRCARGRQTVAAQVGVGGDSVAGRSLVEARTGEVVLDLCTCGPRVSTNGCGVGSPDQCVWAAEIGGRLVGTIGLVPDGAHVAHIHRFRVEPDWQHTAVLAKLIGQLYEHCCSEGYVRVVLDASIAPQWLWRLLVRRGFRLVRRIRGPRSEVVEFALQPGEST